VERAAVVPLARAPPPDARNGLSGEKLLLISVVDAEGLVIITTIWATTPDLRAGHRLTRIEDIASAAALMLRLSELAPLLWPHSEPRRELGAGDPLSGPRAEVRLKRA